jgi:ATP-dependent DNA helicase RecG
LTETKVNVLGFVADQPRSSPEIAGHLNVNRRSGHFYRAVDHLQNLGFLELTIPDKPQSKNQRMRITEKGRSWLARKSR